MSAGFSFNTLTVDDYVTNTVTPARDDFATIMQWLVEHHPGADAAAIEKFVGIGGQLVGSPENFHQACEKFAQAVADFYNEVVARQQQLIDTLNLLVSGGNAATMEYARQDREASDALNKILQEMA